MSGQAVSGQSVVLISHGFQGNYERGFSNGLCESGVNVTLISSDRTDHAGLNAGIRDVNLRGSQEEARPRHEKLLNMLGYHVRLLLYVMRHRSNVVHVIGLIDPPLLCGVLEGLWFRLVARRYVLTVHDLLPHDRHTKWNQRLYDWSFRLAHHLVVHTKRMKEALIERHGIAPARISVMEHGIEPLPAAAMRRSRAIPALPQVLFFGKVARYKGIDLLLDALDDDLGGQLRLQIVGTTLDKALQSELEARIANHRWRMHITWRNTFVPEDEVESVFCGADMLALPYRHIDQSGVLFQAMRYGLPMIATRVGSFAHYVSPSFGELCEPENAHDLSAAMRRLLARLNEVSRDTIVEKSREYEWPRTVGVLKDVYASAERTLLV